MKILRDLLFIPTLRFSDLKPLEMENSQFKFHLDKLIEHNFIKKENYGYTLTKSGKEFANRMDTVALNFEVQPKTTTKFCPVRELNGEKEYLIYTRLKNPFYNCQGFGTEKVKWGEPLNKAAERGLKEESGLEGTAELFAVKRYFVYSQKKELLEDKIFYCFKLTDIKGELSNTFEGEFYWVKKSEIPKIVINPLEEFEDIFNSLKNFNGTITFEEKSIVTTKF